MSTMIKVFCSIGVALLEGAGRAVPRGRHRAVFSNPTAMCCGDFCPGSRADVLTRPQGKPFKQPGEVLHVSTGA